MSANKTNKEQGTTLQVKSVGDLAIKLLTMAVNPEAPPAERRRLTNAEILEKCLETFPAGSQGKGTTPACINWYASRLRQDPAYRAKHGGLEPLAPRSTAKTVEVAVPAKS